LFVDPFSREYLQPTQCHLAIGPRFDHIGPIPENDMEVVGHDGVGEHIDAEDGGEFLDPLSNPFLSVGKILAGDLIEPAQLGPPHAPLHHEQDGYFVGGKDFRTFWSRYKQSPQNRILPTRPSPHNRCLAPSGAPIRRSK
jgi:hypothetical protein